MPPEPACGAPTGRAEYKLIPILCRLASAGLAGAGPRYRGGRATLGIHQRRPRLNGGRYTPARSGEVAGEFNSTESRGFNRSPPRPAYANC